MLLAVLAGILVKMSFFDHEPCRNDFQPPGHFFADVAHPALALRANTFLFRLGLFYDLDFDVFRQLLLGGTARLSGMRLHNDIGRFRLFLVRHGLRFIE